MLILALQLAVPVASAGPATEAVRQPALDICDGTDVRVVGATPADRADVCRGARAAVAFLAGHGLSMPPEITVEVTAELPEVAGVTAAGCYIESRQRAYLLPYAEFRKRRTWFGVTITRELYASVAAHETAHAVAACNFTAPNPGIQAKEYVAYVAMFATMPASLRSKALGSMPGSGFADVNRVSSFVYLFDPMRFGAEAYRHFLQLPDGSAFLKDVLSGKVLAE